MPQQPQPPKPDPTLTFTAKAGLPGSGQPLEVHPAVGDIKPWDLDDLARFVHMGKPRPRREGPLKVTGRARYTYDVKLPGMLYGRMIGASVPAAEILSIDTSAAEALPGVKAVWTTESRVVRFAGQDVAAVAAVSPDVARDAARLVKVRYKERPFTHELRDAMRPDAPRVFDMDRFPTGRDMGRSGNVAGPRPTRANRGDVDKGFAEAELTHEGSYYCPVHTHAPLETHGVVAHWEGDQLTIYASTQAIFAVREGVAEALGVDRKNVKVICEHMGGGFGSKLGPSATGSAFSVVACRLAKLAGAPVKLFLDRHQEHLCTGNAPSALMKVKLGAKKDGTLTAVHYQSWGSAGVAGGAGTAGPANALHGKNPNYKADEWDVFTNAGPAAPLRAPGHSQGAFGIESAMDELADKLGIDPVELRKKNEASPVRMAQYDVGAKAIGWERRNKQAGDMSTGAWGSAAGPAQGSLRRGLGMANGNWYVFAAESSNAQVRVNRDGSVEVITGCQDIGTGYRTAMAIVAAEELGIDPGDVTLRLGDTTFPEGPGSGGSVTTNSVAPAVRLAASQAREQLHALAAGLLGASAADLTAANGRISVKGDGAKSVSFKQAAAKMSGESIDCLVKRAKQYETFRGDLAGTQFAEVEVDVETGVVRVVKMVSVNDCGLPVNPLTTQSQVLGAMIQGASWALFENRLLDRNVGTMVNPNLEWYKILAPADMFEAESILTPVANAGNNTSTAGIGEPPIVPTLAAVANAVFNAIGARIRELPITPDRVLQALSEARRA
ncbi:MAG: xanthine dehydrogenase family protein molybdopterin-binding subunit [Vicinamibacterales bacterium]